MSEQSFDRETPFLPAILAFLLTADLSIQGPIKSCHHILHLLPFFLRLGLVTFKSLYEIYLSPEIWYISNNLGCFFFVTFFLIFNLNLFFSTSYTQTYNVTKVHQQVFLICCIYSQIYKVLVYLYMCTHTVYTVKHEQIIIYILYYNYYNYYIIDQIINPYTATLKKHFCDIAITIKK